jgi:hypothetical protein
VVSRGKSGFLQLIGEEPALRAGTDTIVYSPRARPGFPIAAPMSGAQVERGPAGCVHDRDPTLRRPPDDRDWLHEIKMPLPGSIYGLPAGRAVLWCEG